MSNPLAGIICKMCGETLETTSPGKEANCPACEEKLVLSAQGVEEGDMTVDLQNLISGPYLTSACIMIAEQFIHRDKTLWPTTRQDFNDECTKLLRYHAPIAYAYFFETTGHSAVLPSGTTDIIIEFIWRDQKCMTFLGGRNSGIILPGQSF